MDGLCQSQLTRDFVDYISSFILILNVNIKQAPAVFFLKKCIFHLVPGMRCSKSDFKTLPTIFTQSSSCDPRKLHLR